MTKIILQFSILLLIPLSTFGQLNFVSGYQFGFVNFEQTNKILDTYNTNTPDVIKKFKPISYMQGFKGGLRYTIENFHIFTDVNINVRGVRSKTNSGSGESNAVVTFNNYIYSLGLAYKIDKVTIGGSFNYSTTKTKSDVFSEGSKKTLVQDNLSGNTLFIEYQLTQTERLEVGIRPYWNIFYGGINSKILDQYLLPSDLSVSNDVTTQNINTIGISLILYNGRQD